MASTTTDLTRKRKASVELLPVRYAWDRTTYRVRNIAQDFDRRKLSEALTKSLELENPSDLKIHSIVSQCFDEPRDKVATVSFRRRPNHLVPSSDEWHVDLSDDDDECLYIDSRFHNFTPLYSDDSTSRQRPTIE